MKSKGALVMIVLGLLALPLAASADNTVDLTIGLGAYVDFTYGSESFTGQFAGQINSNVFGPLYCDDLTRTVNVPGTYTYLEVPLTGTQLDAAKLLQAYGGDVVDGTTAAALQMAMWKALDPTNVTFNDPTTAGSVGYIAFGLTGRLVGTVVGSLPAATGYVDLELFNANGVEVQNQITRLPEPGTILLLGFGLLGLAGVARRRVK